MKTRLYITILAFALLVPTVSDAQNGTIHVTISQIDVTRGGKLKIGVYDVKGFPVVGQGVQEKDLAVQHKTAVWVFKDIPPGRYAVAVFQDANQNNQLDKNLFGAPKEPYGFSQNIFGTFGPPDFEDVSFEIRQEQPISLTINLE